METIDRFDDPYTVEQAICSIIGTNALGFTGLSPNESYSLVHMVPTTPLVQEKWYLAPTEQDKRETVERIIALTPHVTGPGGGYPETSDVIPARGGAIEGILERIPGWKDDPLHKMQVEAIRLYCASAQGRIAQNDMIAYLSKAVSLNDKLMGPTALRTMSALRGIAAAAADEQKRLVEYIERTTGEKLFARPGTEVPARIIHAMERTSVWAPFPTDKLSTLYAEEDGRGIVFAQPPEKRAFGLRFSNPEIAQKLASTPNALVDDERMEWAATLDELPKETLRKVLLGHPEGLDRDQLAALVTVMAQQHAAPQMKQLFGGPEQLYEALRDEAPEKMAELGESIARKSGDPKAAEAVRKLRDMLQPDEEAERLKAASVSSEAISEGWERIPDDGYILQEFHTAESERSTTVFVMDDPSLRAQDEGMLTQVYVAVNRDSDGRCDEIVPFGTDLAAAYQYANPEIIETSCTYATRNDYAAALNEAGLPVTEKMIDKLIACTDGLSRTAERTEKLGLSEIQKEAKSLRAAIEKALASKKGQEAPDKEKARGASLA